MASFGDKLRHAWNAFSKGEGDVTPPVFSYGASYSSRPSSIRVNKSSEKSIVSSVLMRMSVDAAAVDIRHVRLDDNDRFLEYIPSGLDNCLSIEANIDQAARAFRQDMFWSMFNNGTIAIVPVDTNQSPIFSNSYDILTMRVGEIVQWYPRHVRVSLYNDTTGLREEIVLSKTVVAVVENPLYAVMNEPNSTLQRLIRKINMLDAVDEQSSSGKLDLIIQLPYVIKSEARRQQADQRRKDIELQLKGSQYGIAYTDGTEKVTQLNRPAENNLLGQVEFLTNMLYGQLGITQAIFDGTADEATMLNYHSRTIEPVLSAVTEAMKRTFLTKTARSQKQSVMFFRDPFKLVPLKDLAELADKLTRNEIVSSNEFRGVIGFKPSTAKNADELRNKNLPLPTPPVAPAPAQAAITAGPPVKTFPMELKK